ncbi:hypothetical protein ACFL4T_01750 [candidate division KSB1 bacterium]
MLKSSLIQLLFFCMPLSIYCSGDEIDSPDSVIVEEDGLQMKKETEHFSFYVDTIEQEYLNLIAEYLEENCLRINSELKAGSIPRVKMKLWRSSEQFYEVMVEKTGTLYNGATGYVSGSLECCMLSSNYSVLDSKTALHEYAHIVSIFVNSSIPNNPRWLWEAAALYVTGDFVDPASLQYMAAGDFPTIAELNIGYNDGFQKIYAVGYILAEYIVEHWTIDYFIQLIKANGDIENVLGLGVEEFEEKWHEYIRGKYF